MNVEERMTALLEWATANAEEELVIAREEFQAKTGEFHHTDDFYEVRTRSFLDFYLCEWESPTGSISARCLRSRDGEVESTVREIARACGRAERGLFEVVARDGEGQVHLRELCGRAEYRLHAHGLAARLSETDLFQGRLIVVDAHIGLAPGLVFHPPETHSAIRDVIDTVRGAEPKLERSDVLDGLLRILMRYQRFTNVRPALVYRLAALHDREILSAAWAREEP